MAQDQTAQDHENLRLVLMSRWSKLSATAAIVWRFIVGAQTKDYRPELHYMRGPGPKWHAKHAADRG